MAASAWPSERCELVTVVGEAGVGKSRLVAEALASHRAPRRPGPLPPVRRGDHLLAGGRGARSSSARSPSDPAAAAAIRSLLGETDAATSAEEIAWAFRKLLEEQRAPLVVVFDDIQWGEETFLDLVEHVALLSAGAPILLLCMARPELAERRPGWPVALRLEPLAEDDGRRADRQRGPGRAAASGSRARRAGNPLFVEEMVAMVGEARAARSRSRRRCRRCSRHDSTSSSPPSGGVLERGAVEGEVFHRGAVQALAPEETQVTPRLAALVRKELIRPDERRFPARTASASGTC